jgi:hypothetical protein
MSDGTLRERWINEVFRTPLITDATRVALLALAPDMDESGRVSVPRDELSNRLGRHPRKVDDRLKNAVDAGFLQRVSRGQKHRHAVYQATLSAPDGGRADKSLSTPPGGRAEAASAGSQRAGFKHPEKSLSAPDGGRTEQNLSAPDGGRTENAPLYKDHARALTTADRNHTHEQDNTPGDDAVVVQLFDGKAITSLRSKKQTPARKRASEPAREDAFDEFWAAYPRRIAKAAARKAWEKAIKAKADPQIIIAAATRYATDPRRTESDIKYTPHPATWLNQERWTDEPTPAALSPATTQRGGIDQRMTEHAALIAQLAQEYNR